MYSTSRRHLGVDLARQQTAGLHLAQLCGQNLLRDVPDGLFQFAETQGAVRQVTQDEHLPFIADERQRGLDRAGGQFLFAVDSVSSMRKTSLLTRFAPIVSFG